jgi:hypothetical protein
MTPFYKGGVPYQLSSYSHQWRRLIGRVGVCAEALLLVMSDC